MKWFHISALALSLPMLFALWAQAETTVPIRSIQLDKSYLRLPINGEYRLQSKILPSNATFREVSWSTDASGTVSVVDGVVKAIGKGHGLVTATSADGSKTSSCDVEVVVVDFNDINGNTHAEDIRWVATRGLMQGKAKGFFGPEESVTIRQALAVCARILGMADVGYKKDAMQSLRGKGIFIGDDSQQLTMGNLLKGASAALQFATGTVDISMNAAEVGDGNVASRGQLASVARRMAEFIGVNGIKPWGVLDFNIESPRTGKNTTISVADYGAVPGEQDSSYKFMAALKACRERGVSRLVIPKGTYHLDKPSVLNLDGMKDFILDGQGSEIVYSSLAPVMTIKGAERVAVKNLAMDWDWSRDRLASIGKVVAVDSKAGSFDMSFPEVDDVNPDMTWATMNAMDPVALTPGTEGGKEFWTDLMKFRRIDKLDKKTLRVFPQVPSTLPVTKGEVYLVRHYVYEAHAVVIEDSSNLSFQDVKVWSAPGMAFVGGGDTHHWEFIRCVVGLKPGAMDRRISVTADAIHVGSSRGYLKIIGCDFGFMGDDAINVHDNTAITTERLDDRTVRVKGWLSPHSGDTIEIMNQDLSPLNFTTTVVSFENEPDRYILLKLEDPLPKVVGRGFVVCNRRYNSSNYIIRDTYFHENRARGLLLQASNGLLENCRFYKTQGAAVHIETGAQFQSWSEGTGVSNLLIRDNTFDTCNVNDWNSLIYMGVYLPSGRTPYGVFKDISITGNKFINFPSRVAFLSSCTNVVFSNNTITNTEGRRHEVKTRGTIWAELARNVSIHGNSWHDSTYMNGDMVTYNRKSAVVYVDSK